MLSASELADRLAHHAEAVCRHYLSAGRKAGNYWIVGDVVNSKGKSLMSISPALAGAGGRTLRRLNTVTCSVWCARPVDWSISGTSRGKRVASFANPIRRRPKRAIL